MSKRQRDEEDYKFQYVKPDAPDRCQGVSKNGEQCYYRQMHGSKYCRKHTVGAKKKELRMYRLTVWKDRVSELTRHESIYSLTSEIGILRVVLEEMLNKCHDAETLLRYAPAIENNIMKLEKLVNGSVRLENKLNSLLSATAVAAFMQDVIDVCTNIVSAHFPEEKRDQILDTFSDKLESAFKKITEVPGERVGE